MMSYLLSMHECFRMLSLKCATTALLIREAALAVVCSILTHLAVQCIDLSGVGCRVIMSPWDLRSTINMPACRYEPDRRVTVKRSI